MADAAAGPSSEEQPPGAAARLRSLGRDLLGLVADLRREWSRDRVGGLSAEIAFFGLLGLFPAVIVFAALLGSLEVFVGTGAATDVEGWLLDRMVETFGQDNNLRSTIEDLFDRSNAGLITVGVVLTVYASARGFTSVVGALDVAYGHEERRSWISIRLMGFVLTLSTAAVAAVVSVLVVVGPVIGGADELAERLGAGALFAAAWTWLRLPLVFSVVVSWATCIYHLAPRRRTSWRSDLPGAVVATLWWLVVSSGFRLYLDAASSGMNAVFGLLGGALSLLVWLFLLAMGLLVGAEINFALNQRRRARS